MRLQRRIRHDSDPDSTMDSIILRCYDKANTTASDTNKWNVTRSPVRAVQWTMKSTHQNQCRGGQNVQGRMARLDLQVSIAIDARKAAEEQIRLALNNGERACQTMLSLGQFHSDHLAPGQKWR